MMDGDSHIDSLEEETFVAALAAPPGAGGATGITVRRSFFQFLFVLVLSGAHS
jgi:hypothetical protein